MLSPRHARRLGTAALALAALLTLPVTSRGQSAEPAPADVAIAATADRPENVQALLLIRVDPKVYPAHPDAVLALLRSDTVLGQATRAALDGDAQAASIYLPTDGRDRPSSNRRDGLTLVEILVGLDGLGDAQPHSLAEGKAFINRVAVLLEKRLEDLTSRRHRALAIALEDSSERLKTIRAQTNDLESEVRRVQWFTDETSASRHQQAQQEAKIALIALESQREALIVALEKARNEAPSPEEALVTEKLEQAVRALRDQLESVEREFERGGKSPGDVTKMREELARTEAESLRWQASVREKALGSATFQERLIDLSARQAELSALVAAHGTHAEEALQKTIEGQDRVEDLLVRLDPLRSEREVYADETASRLRQLEAITDPEVEVIW